MCVSPINIELQIKNAEFRIMDLLGNTIKQISTKTEKQTIDVSALKEGFYLVNVQTSEVTVTKKIIIQR